MLSFGREFFSEIQWSSEKIYVNQRQKLQKSMQK